MAYGLPPMTVQHLGQHATERDLEAFNFVVRVKAAMGLKYSEAQDAVWNDGDWGEIVEQWVDSCTDCGEWILGGQCGCINADLFCHDCGTERSCFRMDDGTYKCRFCTWLIQCDNCGRLWTAGHLCEEHPRGLQPGDAGSVIVRCPDCGQLEVWLESEGWDHGLCRVSGEDCSICPEKA